MKNNALQVFQDYKSAILLLLWKMFIKNSAKQVLVKNSSRIVNAYAFALLCIVSSKASATINNILEETTYLFCVLEMNSYSWWLAPYSWSWVVLCFVSKKYGHQRKYWQASTDENLWAKWKYQTMNFWGEKKTDRSIQYILIPYYHRNNLVVVFFIEDVHKDYNLFSFTKCSIYFSD